VHPALWRRAALRLLVLHQALILLDVEQLGAVEAVLLRVLDFDDAHGNGVCLPQQLRYAEVLRWQRRRLGEFA
jgi:hypothetical protein